MIEYTVKVYKDGNKEWYLNGQLHRLDGPAVEWASGSKLWYLNGKLHRLDGPAVERSNGTKQWWLHGKLHREDGPAAEYADGKKIWYLNGKRYVIEKEYLAALKPNNCSGKTVVIDGRTYILALKED